MVQPSFFQAPGCPCGSGALLAACCGPLHRGEPAPTAEALMRSRYSAYALRDEHHLLATWDPRDRPPSVEFGLERWVGLRVVEVVDGGPRDDQGIVAFEATYDEEGRRRVFRERSHFVRRRGRWVYAGEA